VVAGAQGSSEGGSMAQVEVARQQWCFLLAPQPYLHVLACEIILRIFAGWLARVTGQIWWDSLGGVPDVSLQGREYAGCDASTTCPGQTLKMPVKGVPAVRRIVFVIFPFMRQLLST
jgi:hypothetical protein